MPLYQLRLPASMDLEIWLDEVTWLVWDELLHHSQLEPLEPHAFVRIREILHNVIEGHLTTYRSCGRWSYCHAGTTPSPWMAETDYRPEELRVHWYILEVRESLEEIVAEATDRVSELITVLLGATLPRGVLDANIETALRRGLGRYLYENPHCGIGVFCDGALRLDPWSRQECSPWMPTPSTM